MPSRCLLWAWPVVTGCSPPPFVTAQAAFCALGWRPHWWLSWPEAWASEPPAFYRTGSCARLGVNTAASKHSHQKCRSGFREGRYRSWQADNEDQRWCVMQHFPSGLVVLHTLERMLSLFNKDKEKTSGRRCKTGWRGSLRASGATK